LIVTLFPQLLFPPSLWFLLLSLLPLSLPFLSSFAPSNYSLQPSRPLSDSWLHFNLYLLLHRHIFFYPISSFSISLVSSSFPPSPLQHPCTISQLPTSHSPSTSLHLTHLRHLNQSTYPTSLLTTTPHPSLLGHNIRHPSTSRSPQYQYYTIELPTASTLSS